MCLPVPPYRQLCFAVGIIYHRISNVSRNGKVKKYPPRCPRILLLAERENSVYFNNAAVLDGHGHPGLYIVEKFLTEPVDNRHV